MAVLGQPAEVGIAGSGEPGAVWGQDRAAAHPTGGRPRLCRGAGGLARQRARLRRPDRVDDLNVWKRRQQVGLGRSTHAGPAIQDMREATGALWCMGEAGQKGFGECIAHKGQDVNLLPGDDIKEVIRIEPVDIILNDNGMSTMPGAQPDPLCRPVHEGRRGQVPAWLDRPRPVGEVSQRGQHLAIAVTSAQRRGQNVALPPQNALGHSGRSARIQHIEVIGGRFGGRQIVRRARQGRFIIQGLGKQGLIAVVGDLYQRFLRWQILEQRGQKGRVTGMVDDDPGVGIGQQITQLLSNIPIIDIERDSARLHASEHGLKIFIPVLQVEGNMVLPRLPVSEVCARDRGLDAQRQQQVGKPPGPLVDLREAEPAVAKPERGSVRDRCSDGFLNLG